VWGDLPARWVEAAPWVPQEKTLVMFCCCRAGPPVAQALAGASCSAGLLGEGEVRGYGPVGRAVRAPRVCLVRVESGFLMTDGWMGLQVRVSRPFGLSV